MLIITSARHAPWPEDVPITDLSTAGLSRASLIHTAKIAAIDSRLVATTGHLSDLDRRAIAASLKRHLAGALSP